MRQLGSYENTSKIQSNNTNKAKKQSINNVKAKN